MLTVVVHPLLRLPTSALCVPSLHPSSRPLFSQPSSFSIPPPTGSPHRGACTDMPARKRHVEVRNGVCVETLAHRTWSEVLVLRCLAQKPTWTHLRGEACMEVLAAGVASKPHQPINQPTSQPANQPANQPTDQPTSQPTNQHTLQE